jgi:hypothetical protein
MKYGIIPADLKLGTESSLLERTSKVFLFCHCPASQKLRRGKLSEVKIIRLRRTILFRSN